jgi:hypothetical protein
MTKQARRNRWWIGLVGFALIASAVVAKAYWSGEYFQDDDVPTAVDSYRYPGPPLV